MDGSATYQEDTMGGVPDSTEAVVEQSPQPEEPAQPALEAARAATSVTTEVYIEPDSHCVLGEE